MEPWKSMLLHYRPAPGSYLEKERNNSPMIHNNLPVYHFGNDESYSNIQLHKQLWRSYTKQSIPFSQLKTPLSDAILAMDRWGSYMIGVGGGDLTRRNDSKGGVRPLLSLKFYAIVSPLIHAVPLMFKNARLTENVHFPAPSLHSHNEYLSPAAIPIRILLSDDGSLGVAFVHHSTGASAWSSNNNTSRPSPFSESPDVNEEDILGTVVIFETPKGRDNFLSLGMPPPTRSFRCSNVRVGGWNSFTMRNSLWPTNKIPVQMNASHQTNKSLLCGSFNPVISAYMLFNDEDDGFRITWIDQFSSHEGTQRQHNNVSIRPPHLITSTRTDILTPPDVQTWEMYTYNAETGHIFTDNSGTKHTTGLTIAFEAYLRVDALLSDILDRRQSSLFRKSPYQNESVRFMPDFSYNLLSVSQDGLGVVLVIVFCNREKMMQQTTKKPPSALGLFVNLNIYDQSYDEVKWVQHPSCNDEKSMKEWCKSLALNWRQKETQVGVFCLNENDAKRRLENWKGGTHEYNTDEDIDDDCNATLWSSFVLNWECAAKKNSVAAPKDVSMSSLFHFATSLRIKQYARDPRHYHFQ
eukprot:g9802.t1 g9802   contig4:612452-614416(-)